MRGLGHGAHKERLSCSILDQMQNPEKVTEEMANQSPPAQAAAREIPAGHKDKHLSLTALFFRGTAKGKQAVSNLQTSSQEEATELCLQQQAGHNEEECGVSASLNALTGSEMLCVSADASGSGKASACR